MDRDTKVVFALPTFQLLVILSALIGSAGSIILGVWVTTRDLKHEVRTWGNAVSANTQEVRKLNDVLDEVLVWQAEHRGLHQGTDRK